MFVYALTILIGSTLLFLIEPMIARYILPWFGGGPSVWSTCMLFFQIFLLGGYAYAHWIGTKLRPRKQAMVHLVLLAISLIFLPITPSESWKPLDPGNPALRIIALLAVTIGLPFALLASSSPLHQYWFSRACPKRSPYWLYSLSNVGSVLGLLAYPFLLEPMLGLRWQTLIWSAAYGTFIASSGWCAWQLWRKGDAPSQAETEAREHDGAAPAPPLGFWRPVAWIVLSACGSVMLLATTNQMCAEVAVIPFLWILPLSLYLLSFILCFGAEWWYHRGVWGQLLLLAGCGVLWLFLTSDTVHVYVQLSVLSLGLFAGCMICHGEMVRLKPAAAHLTAFFLMISVGGALGGVFVNFAAPFIFKGYWEFHIGIFMAFFLFGLLVFRSREARAGELLAWLGSIGLAGLLGWLLIHGGGAQGWPAVAWLETKLMLGAGGVILGVALLALLIASATWAPLRRIPGLHWLMTAVLGGALGWWFVHMMEHRIFTTFPPIAAYHAVHDFLAALGKEPGNALASLFDSGKATSGGARLTLKIIVYLALFILAIATPFGRRFFGAQCPTRVMRAGWLGCLIALGFFLQRNIEDRQADAIDKSRNFYGVLRVVDNNKGSDDAVRALYHGPIEHGNQYLDEERRRQPTTYYSTGSGISIACRLHPKRQSDAKDDLAGGLNLGVVGLGTGTSACMAGPRDTIHFYEINPEIKRIALDDFFYLKDCPGKKEVRMGDARITLERELKAGLKEGDKLDVLALDAFNGDAIPVHLLTRESFKLYWQHLRPDGILAVNISNLHLNLGPVVNGLAQEIGKKMVLVSNDEDNETGAYVTDWALVTSNDRFLNLPEVRGIKDSDRDTTRTIIWTDQYSNLVSVLNSFSN